LDFGEKPTRTISLEIIRRRTCFCYKICNLRFLRIILCIKEYTIQATIFRIALIFEALTIANTNNNEEEEEEEKE